MINSLIWKDCKICTIPFYLEFYSKVSDEHLLATPDRLSSHFPFNAQGADRVFQLTAKTNGWNKEDWPKMLAKIHSKKAAKSPENFITKLGNLKWTFLQIKQWKKHKQTSKVVLQLCINFTMRSDWNSFEEQLQCDPQKGRQKSREHLIKGMTKHKMKITKWWQWKH